MKKRVLLAALMIGLIMDASAQKPTMILTFTADNNGQNVPLNSILIENLTQGGDTTLFAPDTILVLNYVLGIGEDEIIGSNVFTLFQNHPNPMQGQTTVTLYLPERENVLITISNIVGRDLFKQEYLLDKGKHSFTFLPGKESLYFLNACVGQQNQTIKMFNSLTNAYSSGCCKLEYNVQQTGITDYKSGNNPNNFIFHLGDQLQYTASSALGERTIIDSPTGDQIYTFQYASGIPCPGIPTITDIDGNTYNTVLIGDQCWMKENLKTTSYRNGTAIPNVTDDNDWNYLTSGAYVWYDNDISWKDKYGALYNWYTTVDSRGLCPTGWHVPTADEWYLLIGYIGGGGFGNKLKSCRQVNSPLGGYCNTNVHPRWDEDAFLGNYGTDDYGFSLLPGSGRGSTNGSFDNIASYGVWWSSTHSMVNWAWGFLIYHQLHSVSAYSALWIYGYSVRCLRD
jgi:uncharacterized protein (TIGR02145 family)